MPYPNPEQGPGGRSSRNTFSPHCKTVKYHERGGGGCLSSNEILIAERVHFLGLDVEEGRSASAGT